VVIEEWRKVFLIGVVIVDQGDRMSFFVANTF
jgi:hypothetical protein